MELRFVVPNMEKTFGNLEFAGENTTEQQRRQPEKSDRWQQKAKTKTTFEVCL